MKNIIERECVKSYTSRIDDKKNQHFERDEKETVSIQLRGKKYDTLLI